MSEDDKQKPPEAKNRQPLSRQRFIVSIYLCATVPAILSMGACNYSNLLELLYSLIAPFVSIFLLGSFVLDDPVSLDSALMVAFIIGAPYLIYTGFLRRNEHKWQVISCVMAVLLSLPLAIYGLANCS